ncbi:MAG: ABC transporter substrate-binding protein [Lachnospiraceae bacterium]|nr:ABC transporter substrate-binding protein [Lachnospiraceae bacterium]
MVKILTTVASVAALTMSGCTYPMPTAPVSGGAASESTEASADDSSDKQSQTAAVSEEEPAEVKQDGSHEQEAKVRIGSLKGPTSIGLVKLMNDNTDEYSFTIETQADVISAGIVSGDLDIVLIPANVASVLYQKTGGKISVIDINTLGVLYMLSGDDSIKGLKDLEGKTVYTTGAGTTPEFVLKYLLKENGLEGKVSIEFKSEAQEVTALLSSEPESVGMLPQPFATAALAQNDKLKIVADMTEEWDSLNNGSSLVTGVTVARNDFISENPEAVNKFLADHSESAQFTDTDTKTAAEYTAAAGIIEKAPIAEKAIPYCHIVCITGEEMKDMLSGYLNVLYEADNASIGGSLPSDDFYFSE